LRPLGALAAPRPRCNPAETCLRRRAKEFRPSACPDHWDGTQGCVQPPARRCLYHLALTQCAKTASACHGQQFFARRQAGPLGTNSL